MHPVTDPVHDLIFRCVEDMAKDVKRVFDESRLSPSESALIGPHTIVSSVLYDLVEKSADLGPQYSDRQRKERLILSGRIFLRLMAMFTNVPNLKDVLGDLELLYEHIEIAICHERINQTSDLVLDFRMFPEQRRAYVRDFLGLS